MDWNDLDQYKFEDENTAARGLHNIISLSDADISVIDQKAVGIVRQARDLSRRKGLMETFLEEFGLSNNEGLALMCLAEALLRVPDTRTADKLIAEKISSGVWEDHKGQSDSWLVNASTLGLAMTGRIVDVEAEVKHDVNGFMQRLTKRAGTPVIRAAMMQAMRIMGEQFVVGRTIARAIDRSEKLGSSQTKILCSFDMLGEGARTDEDARRYYAAYQSAIEALGYSGDTAPEDCHGISVKLSALHCRYDALREDVVMHSLYPRLLNLAELAARSNINMCLDAEESDRLILSLKLLEKLCREDTLKNWNGLGLAVQAYQKRGVYVCDSLSELAKVTGRRLMVRLVKGAYWDTEIKHAQTMGFMDYPVWTRKSNTDLAYLACARRLFEAGSNIYPQFATHNAHSVAALQHMATAYKTPFEFQRLHGMGEPLYNALELNLPVRIYAPVGAHEDLLPYLVRRLLENGANTSFVHKFMDEDYSPEEVAKSPFGPNLPSRHEAIPLPRDMFGDARENSSGLDLYRRSDLDRLESAVKQFEPINITLEEPAETCLSPIDANPVGRIAMSTQADVNLAYDMAKNAFKTWNARGGKARAAILRNVAERLESSTAEFVAIMCREAGKTFADSLSEVREAVDFLRYYAQQAEMHFEAAIKLPGPAGETNELMMSGRGVFVCISPWNFPLAIFIGQIAAALAAGNTVLSKPAEQTPLTAFKAVKLFYDAGIPKEVLHILFGAGDVGANLVSLKNIAGVAFTGSTEVARLINLSLAQKEGPIPVLIAETGGLNAMFVDTTALREQVIDDVIASAFNAAGQRCSALRILFVPDSTAETIIEGIKGAMDSLIIGDPSLPETDVGPVIDHTALNQLQFYVENLSPSMMLLKQCEMPSCCKTGTFMPPTLIEIMSLDGFDIEQFGPVLHVMRYKPDEIENIMRDFASKGYGLTLGIHSRLNSFVDLIQANVPAGNIYINRNIIGAVVGVQPFGGQGLSGTGPKAGGPHYITRFGTEITITNNITAKGGDPVLLNLSA